MRAGKEQGMGKLTWERAKWTKRRRAVPLNLGPYNKH